MERRLSDTSSANTVVKPYDKHDTTKLYPLHPLNIMLVQATAAGMIIRGCKERNLCRTKWSWEIPDLPHHRCVYQAGPNAGPYQMTSACGPKVPHPCSRDFKLGFDRFSFCQSVLFFWHIRKLPCKTLPLAATTRGSFLHTVYLFNSIIKLYAASILVFWGERKQGQTTTKL